jgi:polyphosphate kinase
LLRGAVEGQSENITIRRIVDRYLEHAKYLCFIIMASRNFMRSADWMSRNLYSRIEVIFPIYDKNEKGDQ